MTSTSTSTTPRQRPLVVCLCGSTRFHDAFRDANLKLTLEKKIVLTIGCDTHSDDVLFRYLTEEEKNLIKADLDELHLRKIDLCDEILVLNVGGYIGQSTANEIAYAIQHGKKVRYLEHRHLRVTLGDGGPEIPLRPDSTEPSSQGTAEETPGRGDVSGNPG